jgi:hypothetical protein
MLILGMRRALHCRTGRARCGIFACWQLEGLHSTRALEPENHQWLAPAGCLTVPDAVSPHGTRMAFGALTGS